MATLKSKRLQEALKKARNVGRAEESVIIDGCSIVLQSLPATAYEAVMQDIADLEGSAYVRAHQLGHVSHSIVELEGVDLRDVTVIEDDVPSGDYLINATVSNETKADKIKATLKELGVDAHIVAPDGNERTVLVEKSAWIRQQLSTWSQEAVAVAYRKFADVVVAGEKKAKEQVQFHVPDESAEDKYRRLLLEAKELEADIPPDLANKVLEDVGYLQKSTPQELEEVANRVREFTEERKRAAAVTPVQEASDEEPSVPSSVNTEEAAALMRNRPRLNQMPVSAPTPATVVNQAPPAQAPQQFRDLQKPETSRAQQIAALEGMDPGLAQQNPHNLPIPREVAELSRPRVGVDAGVNSILDQPPTVGINPKFRRPNV